MAIPQGEWEILKDQNNNPLDSQVTAVHANLIPIIINSTERPKAKVLYWHGRYITNYDNGGKIVSCLYDPETAEIKQYTVPVWPNITDPYDPSKIFCSAHLTLPDGKLLTDGGERNIPPVASRGLKYSFIFNTLRLNQTNPGPWRNTLITGPPVVPTMMSRGRWYPQLTKLQDGKVVAMSGYSYATQTVELRPERFTQGSSNEIWEIYPPEAELSVPLYNGAYLLPFGNWKGEIFYDLVSFGTNENPVTWTKAHRFNPDLTNPGWNEVGQTRTLRYRGNSVVLPFKSTDTKIRIINLGGDGSEKTAEMIEIGNSSNPQWLDLPDMVQNRHDSPNALLLSNGELITIGGGHDSMTVLTPEVLDYSDPDPANWTWSSLPDMEVPRKYHSTALLLQDGSVWVAGSRIYDDPQRWEFENDVERRIEIFKPAYFFDGIRPEILDAPLSINYGTSNVFNVDILVEEEPDIIIESFVLISLPAVTHCFDCNQRYVIMDFVKISKGNYDVTPPLDGYIAPPGYYMLIAIKDKTQSTSGETRIPSEAVLVKLGS
ncbi:MAG: galactose oxidase-like domain-containing protein [Ignavibacteria bacterium]